MIYSNNERQKEILRWPSIFNRTGRKSLSGVYHVMLRGINKSDIFHDRMDYVKFRKLLEQASYPVDELGRPVPPRCQFFAYCMMTNHVHLLVKEESDDIATLIKRVGGAYAQYYNLKYERVGHLFQDRFKSEPVESDAYFITLARNYGFGINGDAFEEWAAHIPFTAIAHHRDDLFQIEAIFLGQAGLLDIEAIPEHYQQQALNEGYFAKLRNEYLYLAHKFSLQPMDYKLWKFLRLRPQNFPHIRLSQLANLYYEHKTGLSQLVECKNVFALQDLMGTKVTPYWETHYTFGSMSDPNEKNLSPFSLNLLMINTCIPMLFAYGRHTAKEELCDRAFDLLEQLKAENNYIIRLWKECGLEVKNAGDSQALIQLKKEYCDKKDCLRCRIGYEYLKR